MPARKKVTLEQIYAKLESHDRHFEQYDRHFEKHDRQFEGITKLIFKMEDSLKAEIANEIAKVMDRIRNLETNMEKQTADLERLQQEYYAVAESLKRIEKTLEDQAPARRSNELSSVLTRLDRIERHLGLTEAVPKA